MNVEELIGWIHKWNPYCEFITLSTIFAKMKDSKGRYNVVNHGPPGTGKSRSTLELVKELDLGNDIILDNTTTAKGLFETFQEYPDSDIILDECSSLLKDLKTQDMVKTAMEGKPLTWTKNGESETTEPYKGNMIINANVVISDTVIDRCLVNKALMNKEMSLDFNQMYIEEYKEKTDFKPFTAYLKKVLNNNAEIGLDSKEISYVLNFVQDKIKELEQNDGFSRRIIIRELSYFQHAKKLFGKLDKTVLNFIQPFAESYIVNAQTPNLIESIIGNGTIEKATLVKRVAREGGWTEQHVRKIINKKILEGELNLKGKLIKQTMRPKKNGKM